VCHTDQGQATELKRGAGLLKKKVRWAVARACRRADDDNKKRNQRMRRDLRSAKSIICEVVLPDSIIDGGWEERMQ
jgi:hypothetical protein